MVTALEPSATVAIIARNEERSIGAAIQSVNDQGVNGVSVLVVDDSSIDATVEVARGLGARVIVNEGSGIVDARNTALKSATTDIIICLDADDRLLPGSLEAVLGSFDTKPAPSIVVGSPRFVDSSGRYLASQPAPPTTAHCRVVAMAFNPFSQSAVAYRRAAVLAVGAYRHGDDTDAAEDYDLWCRLLAGGQTVTGLQQTTALLAIRPTSETVRSATPQARRADAIRMRLRSECRDVLDSAHDLRRMGRQLQFSWTTPTQLDTYTFALARLSARFILERDYLSSARLLAAMVAIGPLAGPWSAFRCAIGFRRRRRARGWRL